MNKISKMSRKFGRSLNTTNRNRINQNYEYQNYDNQIKTKTKN